MRRVNFWSAHTYHLVVLVISAGSIVHNARVAASLGSLLAISLLFSAGVQAQERGLRGNSPPFKLSVEKQRLVDEAERTPTNLRISRDRLNLNSNIPSVAPDYTRRTGAQLDPGNFTLRAQDSHLSGAALAPSTAPLKGSTSSTAPLKGSASFAKALANYDIELIVDESLSMRKRDCPGGMSRWEWCGMQLNDLSTQLIPYAPHGFTLTTFASEFATLENAAATDVHQLFAYPQFALGTRLSRPLDARLAKYLARRNSKSKPLLIVVITDGVPAPRMEPPRVAHTVIRATQQLSTPREVTLVFFQIGGNDTRGRIFLDAMDNELLMNGARYDIVRTVYFEELQRQGLTLALVSSIKDFAQQSANNVQYPK